MSFPVVQTTVVYNIKLGNSVLCYVSFPPSVATREIKKGRMAHVKKVLHSDFVSLGAMEIHSSEIL